MAKKYKTKYCEVEAIQWTGDNFQEIVKWSQKRTGSCIMVVQSLNCLYVDTLEGLMQAKKLDWIICGTENEFYPCKAKVFAKKYQALDQTHIYERKYYRVDAMQWTGDNVKQIESWVKSICKGAININDRNPELYFHMPSYKSNMSFDRGQWVIYEGYGKFYKMDNSDFTEKYKRVTEL